MNLINNILNYKKMKNKYLDNILFKKCLYNIKRKDGNNSESFDI